MWTKEQHEAAKERCAAIKAADYGWPVVHAVDGGNNWDSPCPKLEWDDPSERVFAEHAREDLPEALAEIERLEQLRDGFQEALGTEFQDTKRDVSLILALRAAIKARDASRYAWSEDRFVCPHCIKEAGECASDCPTKQFPNGEGMK
jgi:hypothetical protein